MWGAVKVFQNANCNNKSRFISHHHKLNLKGYKYYVAKQLYLYTVLFVCIIMIYNDFCFALDCVPDVFLPKICDNPPEVFVLGHPPLTTFVRSNYRDKRFTYFSHILVSFNSGEKHNFAGGPQRKCKSKWKCRKSNLNK